MDLLQQFNDAIAYLESHLTEDVSLDRAAQIACSTTDSFQRFFSYMAHMTLKEYLRRRRLTLAAQELLYSDKKILDLAVKYGWDSGDAFTKAFLHQHGMTPTQARAPQKSLVLYPPVSFHIRIKGASKMEFRIVESKELTVYGISRPYHGQENQDREALRSSMWSGEGENIPEALCEGTWNQPGSTAYDGLWYGIWEKDSYLIARAKEDTRTIPLEERTLPAGTYAAFQTSPGGFAGEEIPKLQELIFDSWLPSSGYRQKGDLVIELYHLWTDKALRSKNRYYEILIPVETIQ